MTTKEGTIIISTKSEKAKGTLLKVIQEETEMKLVVPKGEMRFEQSIYNEITVRMLQSIILNNQLSLVTIEPFSKTASQIERKELESKELENQKQIPKGRPNVTMEKILSCFERKSKFTTKELLEATKSSYASINNNLKTLQRQGKIVSVEKGVWRVKNFYDDSLKLPIYAAIVDEIVEKAGISKQKLLEKWQEKDIDYVIKELEISSFIQRTESENYKVSVEFRVWYYIMKKPHVQWNTMKVDMAQKLIDTNTLSKIVNSLIVQKKIERDGKRGYVIK